MPRKQHHYTTSTSLKCWHVQSMDLNRIEIKVHQTRLRIYRPVYLSSIGKPVPTAASAVLDWLKWSTKWFSAVVAQPPQNLTCCAYWDAYLLAYLSYCSLSVSLNKSGYFPFTLSSAKSFCPQTCYSLGVFFIAQFGVNNIDCCVWNYQEFHSYGNIQTSSSGTNNHATVQVSEIIYFFPGWWLIWKLPKAAVPYLLDFTHFTAVAQLTD